MDTRVRLDNALVERGLCTTRTEAQGLIVSSLVLLDGQVCDKPAKKVGPEAHLELLGKKPFVSRGGEKLQGVLRDVYGDDKAVHKQVAGAYVLDVGSSTGGFTDCLLFYGAKEVDCVDVGTSQLHASLRSIPMVHSFENQDIRTFHSNHTYDIIVVDVSFISLTSIIDSLISLGTKHTTKYFLLIKPQFEVGRGNTKKGIVKNKELVDKVLENIQNEYVSKGLREVAIYTSRVTGGDGNQEYFLYGTL